MGPAPGGAGQEERMLSYVTIGADDVPRSARFYAAILAPLGYATTEAADGFEFARAGGLGTVYVRKPYDGREASVGNGSMTAFQAETHDLVRRLHAAGLAAGGSDEGAPGFRDAYSDRFYVGYLRDPVGNKIAIFCTNLSEGSRGRST